MSRFDFRKALVNTGWAKQLLVDAKAAREQNTEEEDSKEEPCHQEDQAQNGSAEK